METKNNLDREIGYLRAQKKVKQVKDFYRHLFSYLIINVFLSFFIIKGEMEGGETFNDAFFDFGTFAVWFFWGIPLLMQAWNVFGKGLIFSKEWESRKIQEFINKDNN